MPNLLEIGALILSGYFIRIMLMGMYLFFLKSISKKKKNKKSKVTLPEFGDSTYRFIGYIGIVSTIYFGIIDIYNQEDLRAVESMNSLIWFGLFLPNMLSLLIYHLDKRDERKEKQRIAEEKAKVKAEKLEKQQQHVNDKNAKFMVNMLQSIK